MPFFIIYFNCLWTLLLTSSLILWFRSLDLDCNKKTTWSYLQLYFTSPAKNTSTNVSGRLLVKKFLRFYFSIVSSIYLFKISKQVILDIHSLKYITSLALFLPGLHFNLSKCYYDISTKGANHQLDSLISAMQSK